VSLIDPAYYIK